MEGRVIPDKSISPILQYSTGRESFDREFRALGYVVGKNIVFEYRSADDKMERLPPWLMSVSKLTCCLRP